MSKRSPDFERSPRDFYPTPYKAVLPLIPYLHRDGIKTFAEFCCGDGDLIQHLESFDLTCVYSGDIVTGQDALKLTLADLDGAQVGITNPPYKHPEDPTRGVNATRLLRELIQHFLDLGLPFWLLLQHDWTTNENVSPFLDYCSDIVVVGRVKWMAGTKTSGMDNSDWLRFDVNHRGDTAFHNDRAPTPRAASVRKPKRPAQVETSGRPNACPGQAAVSP
jgi:hypothetical protein